MPTPGYVPQYGFGTPNTYSGVTPGMLTTDLYDWRGGQTAISTITLIAATPVLPTLNGAAAGVIYDVTYGIFGNAASASTISAAAYILGWTTAGATQTATVSISAVGGYTVGYTVIVPDAGTGVTATTTKGTVNGSAAFTVFACLSRSL
jgi:hypothetical protein